MTDSKNPPDAANRAPHSGEMQKRETQNDDLQRARASWDSLAEDWRVQVGEAGDRNRFLNSDPVLWRLAGEVRGKRVLDAGCGTGYLTRQLADRGAEVVGVDFSPRMIEVARKHNLELDFRVDSTSELATCSNQEFDLLVSNYVLMDTPELEAAVGSFFRVLKPGATAIVVFSHPCFPAGRATPGKGDAISYHFPQSYFEQARMVDPPWGHFKAEFVWYHRPLEDYFRAFTGAGFQVAALEEPHLTEDRYHLAADQKEQRKHATRSYSIVFRLVRAEDR